MLTAGYNGDGLRAWKQNSGGRTYFLYDGINPVNELDASGNLAATNTFGAGGLASRRAGTSSVFYSFDSEGNLAQRSDSSGAVSSNHFFSAHGVALSGALTEPFGYKAQVGYYTDAETGLHLLTHRYYDPNTGRFLTRDPIGYGGGLNLYSYVVNNPTNSVDALGLSPSDWADWIDSNLDYADEYWRYDGDEPVANFINETVIGGSTDTARGLTHYLRVGSGTGDAIHKEDENGYGRAALVLQDVERAAGIFTLLGGLACGPAAAFEAKAALPSTISRPRPPGWTNEWQWRYPEGTKVTSPRWFDPKGGEWRYHPADKWHPEPHWDHNPWTEWNSPWRNVPLK